jgi:hypothetical protein
MDKADIFEITFSHIIEAGIETDEAARAGVFLLFDADGELWKKQAWEMNADDVVEYIDNRFGPVFAGWCKHFSQLTTH